MSASGERKPNAIRVRSLILVLTDSISALDKPCSGWRRSVGEIVDAVEVGQSTVSAHLKILADVGFVLVERRGTSGYYRINDACVDCFPSAADVVMGRPVPAQPTA
jgi:DNA-binding transcriptional ArsR family regulator